MDYRYLNNVGCSTEDSECVLFKCVLVKGCMFNY